MLSERERHEITVSNESGRPPIVFVHGLWMLASSWRPWRDLFESQGYSTIAPGWPDDPESVADGRAHPERFAGKSVRLVTDHMAEAIKALNQKPAIIGHSFGGLITQQLAGRGLATASVAIDSAPFRGVLPLPYSALKSAWPVIGNPLNYRRSVMLSYKQFRYAFGNAISSNECQQLYEAYPVPGSGIPLFQAAAANFNPGTQIKAESRNPRRGPMLMVTGELDHIAPGPIARASFKKQKRNTSPTEIVEIPKRGHSLVFDSGWPQVAQHSLTFLQRYH
jgi:non-heme chloroperoxidase